MNTISTKNFTQTPKLIGKRRMNQRHMDNYFEDEMVKYAYKPQYVPNIFEHVLQDQQIVESKTEAVLKKGEKLAGLFNATMISDQGSFSICRGQVSIKFKCQNQHIFYKDVDSVLTLDYNKVKADLAKQRYAIDKTLVGEQSAVDDHMDRECWCPQCVQFLRKVQTSVDLDKFQIIGGLFTKTVLVQCKSQGHITEVSPIKKTNLKELQCRKCQKQQRDEKKRIFEEKQAAQNRLLAEEQRKMFDEIKKKQDEEERLQDEWDRIHETYFQAQRDYFNQKQYTYDNQYDQPKFTKTKSQAQRDYDKEQAISEQADRLSNEFLAMTEDLMTMSQNDQIRTLSYNGIYQMSYEDAHQFIARVCQLQYDNVYLVYKLTMTPLEVISSGLQKLSNEQRKNYYKSVAKYIHPDKNIHPKAKEAFQKIRAALANVSQI